MAANILWAHLLRKDVTTTTTSDSPSQIPQIAPIDKSGTSMRMLIHDTQANLEKFSARLDGLLQRVEECKMQVVNANKLLDVERDKVLAEVLQIANRCQAEIKTHIGMPAQVQELDLVRVSQISTDKAIQALEKRIDALQVLFQTHTNTMQFLQHQQTNILGAVLPLVPLIQGVPSQIDQIKSALSEMVSSAVSNAVSSLTANIENVKTTLVHEVSRAQERRIVRSSTHAGSGSSSNFRSGALRKRPASSMQNGTFSSPLAGRDPGPTQFSIRKRPRLDGTTHRMGNIQSPRKLSRLDIQTTGQHDPLALPRTPRTPRQPLADLIPPRPPGSSTTAPSHRLSSGYMRPNEPGQSRSCIQDGAGHTIEELATSGADVASKAIKIEELLRPTVSGIISINSSPLSSVPASSAPLEPTATRTGTGQPSTQELLQALTGPTHTFELLPALSPSNPLPSTSNTSPSKPMSLRDRRAQMSRIGRTETRRFIPLVPWSDEEE